MTVLQSLHRDLPLNRENPPLENLPQHQNAPLILHTDARRAMQLYWRFAFPCMGTVAFICIIFATHGDIGRLSLRAIGIILATAIAINFALVPAFYFLYFIEKRKTWVLTNDGIDLRFNENIIRSVPWREINGVQVMRHGASLEMNAPPKREKLYFVNQQLAADFRSKAHWCVEHFENRKANDGSVPWAR